MATIIGINQPETLIGTIYNDNIKGLGGNDTLIGDSGNDTLDGGTGNDSLSGGDGNDTYIVDSSGDIVTEENGSGGDSGKVDTVKSSVDWTLGAYLENLTLTGKAINGNGNALNNWILGNSASNVLFGGDGNDSIRGFALDDTIYGEAGNDKLDGGDGNDYLQDSLGNNSLCGGAGDDSLDVSNSSSGNNLLDGGSGNDYLYAVSSGGNNTLKGGAGNDYLSAYYSSGNNLLDGGSGNDTLNASVYFGSNNTLKGGAGDDSLNVDSSGNLVDGGSGNDTLSFSDGNNILKGGDGDDYFYDYYSQSGDNVLSGGDGNDYFSFALPRRGSGTQTVDGGTGNDTLQANYYYAREGIVTTVDSTSTNGTITASNYQINFQSIENFIITGTEYTDSLLGGNGNDSLNGRSGDDTIKGSAGDDTLSLSGISNSLVDGGIGDDSLSTSFYFATEGIVTTLDSTTTNGTITVGNSQIIFQNIERFSIFGTEYTDSLLGGNGNDILVGGLAGNDTIKGGAGDDYIEAPGYDSGLPDSYSSNSLLDGGDGNDYFNVYNPPSPYLGGTFTLDGGTGNDILNAGYSFGVAGQGIVTTLDSTTNNGTITVGNSQIIFQNIERFSIFGTEYTDSLLGGNGNDTLNGGLAGNDTIKGGAGDDSIALYYPASHTEIVLVDGGTGSDHLSANYYFDLYGSPSYSNAIVVTLDSITTNGTITNGNYEINFQNIEALSIIGSGYGDSIVGGNGNDYLVGGDGSYDSYGGDDTLKGGAGNDTLSVYDSYGNNLLIGGEGNDVLIGADGVDSFIYNNYTEGVDTINNFNSSQDLIQVSANGFGGGLVAGSLSETQFVLGTAATTSTQRFIYDNTTGALYFDLDGSDSGFTQQQLAQITGGVSLSASNFTIV
ncbi:hypothetical protein NIES4103_07030 [Nostoc sp. NIES-4103]|nr:hypothetical protein NIES4103_07030 [Nostoc sp. NIES-4103]